MLFSHPPSPLQELTAPILKERGVRLLIKRDDQLALPDFPAFCGNKWRKLKYNLQAAREAGHNRLLTFGGAYSNHIAAVAAAGAAFGFATVGVIRGEAHPPLNATLSRARTDGMELTYLDRTTYRRKNEPEVRAGLERRFGPCYLIPEGGSNGPALRGCAELARELDRQLGGRWPDLCCLSVGTGGTLAGLVAGIGDRCRTLGFPALKGDFLKKEIAGLLATHYPGRDFPHWDLQTDYHFGGYARFRPALIEFINRARTQYDLPLDPVYTGKLFFGLFDLIEKGAFPAGSTVLAVHTGGLQGVTGFNERFGGLIG